MNKTTKIIIWAVLILSIWVWWYAYISSESGEDNILTSFVKEAINKVDDLSINYTFNTKASLNIKDRGRENGFDLEIKNWSLITKDAWLKERIQLKEGNLSIIGEDSVSLKNVDIVSDNEKLYYKWDFWKILSGLLPDNIKEVLKEWKYVKVDNSKAILAILWDLQNNELIKELAIWMTTSNPEAYYKNNKTIEKLLKTLKSDDLINFVFKDGEYDEVTKKTSLLFNEKLCTLTPVITKSLWEFYPMFSQDLSKDECVKALEWANQFLSFVNIYKEWDSKEGNYKFVINQWTALDLNIDYKEHIIDTWYVSITEPSKKIIFKANWNTKEVLSSLIKLNIEESWIKAIWEIKDWEWKIVVSSNKNSEFTLNWFLDVSKYRLNSYELNWNSWDLKLISKANKEEWKLKITSWKDYSLDVNYKDNVYSLDLKSKDVNANWKADENKLTFNLDAKDYSGKQFAKIDLSADYSDLLKSNYDLDLKSILWDIKSEWNLSKKYFKTYVLLRKDSWIKANDLSFELDLKNEKIIFNYTDYDYDWEKYIIINTNYNKWILIWEYLKRWEKEVDLTWNFKNLWEFDILFNNIRYEEKSIIKAKKDNNIYKYNLSFIQGWKKTLYWNAEIKIEDKKITSSWNFKSEEEKIEANYNFEFDYKKWEAKYELPKEFKEIDIKLLEMNVLPNFEEILKVDKMAWSAVVITWLTTAGTISYISMQGYSNEAKNAKVSSDLTTITRVIEIKVAEWASRLAFVINNNKNRLTNLNLAWKKATKENYSVWTPNYTALGIKREEFLDPSWKDYVIWITRTGGGRMEISWVVEVDWKKQSIIKWNYSPRDNKKYIIDSFSGKIITLNSNATNAFKNWDYVKIWPVKYNVERVKRDWVTVVLDKEVVWKFTKISLVESEWKGLISDYKDNTKTVISGSNYSLPY